jgi:hypothetical protein
MNTSSENAPTNENSRQLTKKNNGVNQSIRKIDFKNFTYTWFPLYAKEKGNVVIKRKIVLRNGENELQKFPALQYGGPATELYQEFLGNVSYADLTGDGKEEAIVTVEVELHRWIHRCIFVYQEKKGKADLLWKYELGKLDFQSDSFLRWRGHKVINNDLVIEEYPTGFDEEKNCCPKEYFRKTFSWNGKTFQEKSSEVIPFGKKLEIKGYPSDDSPN